MTCLHFRLSFFCKLINNTHYTECLQDEIDIVGLYAEGEKALVAEVKRQSQNLKPDLFALKVEALRKKVLFKYEIESRLFSMEDM